MEKEGTSPHGQHSIQVQRSQEDERDAVYYLSTSSPPREAVIVNPFRSPGARGFCAGQWSQEDERDAVYYLSTSSPPRWENPDSVHSSDIGSEDEQMRRMNMRQERPDSVRSSNSGTSLKSDGSKEEIINFKGKKSTVRKMLELIATFLEEADSDSSYSGSEDEGMRSMKIRTPPQRAESSKTSDKSIKDEKAEETDLEVLKITIQIQKQKKKSKK